MIPGVLKSFAETLDVECNYELPPAEMLAAAAGLDRYAWRVRGEGDRAAFRDHVPFGARDAERAARGWRLAADAREALEAVL